MRVYPIVLSLLIAPGLGCTATGKKKADPCAEAKGLAAEKWQAAVKAWAHVEQEWKDPKLLKVVTRSLLKKASTPVEKAAVQVELKSFEGYLTFKKAHASRSLEAARAAHAAAKGKDLRLARKKGVRALGVCADKSAIRSRKSPWFDDPNVVFADELQRKAHNLVTEGSDLSKRAAKICSK